MWWRFRKRAEANRFKDPWLYARADEADEPASIAGPFFTGFYARNGAGLPKDFDLERVEKVDRSMLRVAGTYAGREIFYEAVG